MYRHGHTGVCLLLYAPVGYLVLSAGRPTLAAAGLVVLVWLAMVPDLDMKIPFLAHRGPTHTFLFAVFFGLVCGAGGWILGSELTAFSSRMLGGFGFFLGVLVVISHLLADVLTPMGIAPFWPLSPKRYSLSLFYASNAPANYLLLLIGVGATVAVLWFAGIIR
ncbi:MAG TPA: metal-dependent hydrolase [Halococcus sp.]|nr:metal-dependent hydrolase [Halococcus sp.]